MSDLVIQLLTSITQFGSVGIMLALTVVAIWWITTNFTRWAIPHADRMINKWEKHIDTIGLAVTDLQTISQQCVVLLQQQGTLINQINQHQLQMSETMALIQRQIEEKLNQ